MSKKKTGRRGKYEEWLGSDNLLLLNAWARDGLTDEQISHNIGVTTSTLYEWKKKYPEISESLKRGKEVVDVEVENTLLKKALGDTKTIKEPMKLKKVLVENGTRREAEDIVYVDKEIYIPPDVTALIFWLKNRKPDKWRDKGQVDSDASVLELVSGVLSEVRRQADAINKQAGRIHTESDA